MAICLSCDEQPIQNEHVRQIKYTMAIENEMLHTWVKLLNVSKGLNSLLMGTLVILWFGFDWVLFLHPHPPSTQKGNLDFCTF